MCDRVAIIDEGQIAAIDTPERLKGAFQRVQSVEVALEPEMAPWTLVLAYLSPLTNSQDLMNHAVLGTGMLSPWLDLVVLLLSGGVFLMSAVWMHKRSRRLGY